MNKKFLLALDKLLTAGQMCSNCCYNLQYKGLDEKVRESLVKSFIAWDIAATKINELRRKLEKKIKK